MKDGGERKIKKRGVRELSVRKRRVIKVVGVVVIKMAWSSLCIRR